MQVLQYFFMSMSPWYGCRLPLHVAGRFTHPHPPLQEICNKREASGEVMHWSFCSCPLHAQIFPGIQLNPIGHQSPDLCCRSCHLDTTVFGLDLCDSEVMQSIHDCSSLVEILDPAPEPPTPLLLIGADLAIGEHQVEQPPWKNTGDSLVCNMQPVKQSNLTLVVFKDPYDASLMVQPVVLLQACRLKPMLSLKHSLCAIAKPAQRLVNIPGPVSVSSRRSGWSSDHDRAFYKLTETRGAWSIAAMAQCLSTLGQSSSEWSVIMSIEPTSLMEKRISCGNNTAIFCKDCCLVFTLHILASNM